MPEGSAKINSLEKEQKMVSTTMPTFGQLNPMFIGWDKVFDRLANFPTSDTYPPYNVIKLEDDNHYLIELAVAGYKEEDLELKMEDNNLTIKGFKKDHENEYLHKGIASRSFTKTFSLAEYFEVRSAGLEDGILNIILERNIPEAKKPKVIEINSNKTKAIKGK